MQLSHDNWIFITLKTNTMKNRCKGIGKYVLQHNF